MFLKHILTFSDTVAHRHMHGYVKRKCASESRNFSIRHIEKGHEPDRDCELAQELGMKVPGHHSPK